MRKRRITNLTHKCEKFVIYRKDWDEKKEKIKQEEWDFPKQNVGMTEMQ